MRFYEYGVFPEFIKEIIMEQVANVLTNEAFVGHPQEWYEGFMRLRAEASPSSKLGIPSFNEFENLTIVESHKLAEKLNG